jgi:hypothetical protein
MLEKKMQDIVHQHNLTLSRNDDMAYTCGNSVKC